MKTRLSLTLFVIFLTFSSTLSAQETTAGSETNVRSFPYVAEIISDDVYIRSGPGTNYYDCGKLKQADRVKVVGTQHGWSRIVPTPESFSWISKQYVDFDPNTPAVGVVTGDAVRVYAGSEHVKPLYSTTLQGKLNRQDKVKLLGEEKGGYYKIAPPPFAYLWVSSKYTNPIESPSPPAKPPEVKPLPTTPTIISPEITTPSDKLETYHNLDKQIKAELKEPMEKQNYDDIKKALQKLANDKKAGKAARYAQFSLKRIERLQLALKVAKQVRLQDKKLQDIEQQIENARAKKLEQIPDLGMFDAVGTIQTSGVYSSERQQRHYRLIDESGKTICYALPAGTAEGMDVDVFVGTRVGLTGNILPHPQTSGAIIEFTDISLLQ